MHEHRESGSHHPPASAGTRPARGRRRRRLTGVVAILAFALTVVAGTVAVPTPATAAPLYGHDVSWPQCPSAVGGFNLPMPPTSTAFVIVGLTRGLAFTTNPCLASQVGWVRTHGKPAHAYTMATYPTAAQLSTYGSSGPWGTATQADRLRNVGYAEARYTLGALREVGWSPPVIWIDVEPRPAQPWPSSTSAQRLANRHVLTGLMQGMREAGVGFGFYSYTAGWQEITDSWQLPGVAVWATAGRLDYPTEAQDRCVQPSFSGGQVLVSQWYDDTRDYDLTCGTYAFTPFDSSEFYLNNSFSPIADVAFHYGAITGDAYTGDWNGNGTDTVAVRNGSTFRIRNSNTVGLADLVVTYGRAGDEVLVGDWDGNGTDTIAVRRGATYYIKNTLGPGTADLVVTYGRAGDEVLAGDWDGNGTDTIAVRRGAVYYIKNTLGPGSADYTVQYGRAGDEVLAGDWDGNGTDTLTVRRGATYYIKNSMTPGVADIVVVYGRAGDDVYSGDWNNDRRDTLGVRRIS